ncbi:Serpin B9 [Araneus ventricosus]|uniref:Serpin B9 n=1 Tax=Araneus ventricosus TaxID=182803 RepID=A0A4Y2DN65_ARAVE|nr:Serpin B9 [Araneus ventricosus]
MKTLREAANQRTRLFSLARIEVKVGEVKAPSPNFRGTQAEERLTLDRFNMHQSRAHDESSVELNLEPATLWCHKAFVVSSDIKRNRGFSDGEIGLGAASYIATYFIVTPQIRAIDRTQQYGKAAPRVHSVKLDHNMVLQSIDSSNLRGNYKICCGELKDVLGYQKAGMTKESVHLAFKRFLTDKLKKSAKFTLNAANAILVDNELGLSSDFKKKVQKTYFANVSNVDFQTNTSEILNGINSWVSKQTNGKISQLLDSLDQKTVFIILNAVYFKSLWKYPFDPKNNHWRTFLNNNQESEAKSIQMMRMTKRFGISSVSDCEALELPYIVDDVVMLIMLPKRGLKSLEQKLSHRSIVKIFKAMRYTRVNAAIPKFKIEFYRSLVPELKRLGVKTVFENADFSGMIENESVPVSDFLHKAVIEVNEEGTEAAAATSTKTTKSLIPVFVVDRPFVFAIVDKRTNFVLFLGRVSNL